MTLYNTAGEVVHKVDIPELPANISYAMDSAGHFGYAKVPTPGAENSTAISKTLDGAQNIEAPKSLIVNEVLRGENGFVEVRNNSSKTIQLHDFYLSDNADKVNKWRFPQQTLEPGALAAVNLAVPRMQALQRRTVKRENCSSMPTSSLTPRKTPFILRVPAGI